MTAQRPRAFMSYAHADDKYGQLSEFRERLSNEVQVQTGEEFPIFQDRKDILLGQDWRQSIDKALQEEVTFLIAIITPSFFKSDPCREELEAFLHREKSLGRSDLIFPIYFVNCRVLEDEGLRASDPLAQEIAERQWADWRGLRFEPFDSPQSSKAIMQIASQIQAALERIASTQQAPPQQELSTKDVARPINAFLAYTHQDQRFADQLRQHLTALEHTGIVQGWNYRVITPEGDSAGQLSPPIAHSQIILFLISPSFLASDYCYGAEMTSALHKHEAGEAVVIPIILRPCDWGGTPFAKLQALPSNARPITTWRTRDEAFLDVAKGIRNVAAKLAGRNTT